jgi:hypothetical protein
MRALLYAGTRTLIRGGKGSLPGVFITMKGGLLRPRYGLSRYDF